MNNTAIKSHCNTENILYKLNKVMAYSSFINQFFKCGLPGDVCGQGGRGLKWPKICGRPLWTAPYQLLNVRQCAANLVNSAANICEKCDEFFQLCRFFVLNITS